MGKGGRRHFFQSLVRPTHIVVLAPSFDSLSSFLQCFEPVYIQTFIAQRSVEGLDEAVVGRLAGSAEVDPHPVVVGPQIEQAPRELAAVVDKHPARGAKLGRQLVADAVTPSAPIR